MITMMFGFLPDGACACKSWHTLQKSIAATKNPVAIGLIIALEVMLSPRNVFRFYKFLVVGITYSLDVIDSKYVPDCMNLKYGDLGGCLHKHQQISEAT
jgi:hypothetical protein